MSAGGKDDDKTVIGGGRVGGSDPAGGGAASGSGPNPLSGEIEVSGEDASQKADIDRLNAGNVPTHEKPGSGEDVLDAALETLEGDTGAGGNETREGAKGWLADLLSRPNDDPKKTIGVALALCMVCSIVVSGAAVLLRPAQQANAELDRRKNVVEVAGLIDGGEVSAAEIEELFGSIERRIVELGSGDFTDEFDDDGFDQRAAAADPEYGVGIAPDSDIAGLGRRSRYAEVFLVRDGDALEQVVLPVHGLGLWSTLYGFVALEGDLRTISGLKFYDHAETAGLGGEIENVAWRRQWEGKLAFDEEGELRIAVARGTVPADSPDAAYSVDGLAGATLTSRGVTNLLRYWLDEEGFGPFLERLGDSGAASESASGAGAIPGTGSGPDGV